jgi:hypothetical protein
LKNGKSALEQVKPGFSNYGPRPRTLGQEVKQKEVGKGEERERIYDIQNLNKVD